MAPTRSAASRRKRNSTNTSLDFLNSVMNSRASVADERQTQSARSARQLRNVPRAPRRDIWELPDSPERSQSPITRSPPLAAAETPTPRRSARLQSENVLPESPLRTSRRTKRADIDYREDNMDEGESWQSSREGTSQESVDESKDPDIFDDGSNDLIGNLNLFSDEDRELSPSAFQLEQSLEQSGRFESTQSTPIKAAPNQSPKSATGSQISLQSASKSYRSTPEVLVPAPSVVIRSSPHKVPETPLRRQLTRSSPAPSRVKDDDGDVGMDDNEHEHMEINGYDDDEVSDYENTDSSSSSGLFVLQDSPHWSSLPATRSRKHRQSADTHVLRSGKSITVPTVNHASETSWYDRRRSSSQEAPSSPRQSGVHRLNRPRKSPSSRPVSEANHRESSRTLASRRIRNRASRIVINYSDKETPEPESSYPRCKEALKFGRQQKNWEQLINEARRMKRKNTVNSAMEEHFKDITDLIDYLQQWYEGLYQRTEPFRRLSSKDVWKHEKLLRNILLEGNKILDYVYDKVTEGRKSSRNRGRKIFEAFEAGIIPAIIELIFAAFDAYHSNSKGFPDIYDHLHAVLAILLDLSNRMTSLTMEKYVLTKERYVPTTTSCQYLRYPLQELIQASKTDLLKDIEPDSSDHGSDINESSDQDEDIPPPATQRPWTDAEGYALLDGLLRHHGPGRYALIMRDFGDKLRGRTIGELRQKARETHDQFVPQIEDQLRTREGREEWRWLLSVRE
ncbi:hypothetical protein BDW62DRAFT_4374 [Aspergillus aurantiobrunneus]